MFRPDAEVLSRIHAQLLHLTKIGLRPPKPLAADQVSSLIEVAFWASLRSNEGRPTRLCVVVGLREELPGAVTFTTALPYEESLLAKLAHAVPRGGFLAVSHSGERWEVWGLGRARSAIAVEGVQIEVTEPGTVLVGVGPFQPFAVLSGRSSVVIEGSRMELAFYLQRVLAKKLPSSDINETQAVWRECLALADLSRAISEEGHGGMLLLVPPGSESIEKGLNPFAYRFVVPDESIPRAIRAQLAEQASVGVAFMKLWESGLPDDIKNMVSGALAQPPWHPQREILSVAALSGVDGAIVVTRDMAVLGFGATIAVADVPRAEACVFRVGPGLQPVSPSPLRDLGGTRHQSAARFAGAYHDSVAIVVSQDRHMSVVHWHEPIAAVAVVRNAEWLG